MSLCNRLVCFADFGRRPLLAVLFLPLLSNKFFNIYLPTLFAAVLKFFLPLTTSAISGAAISNKSTLTLFAAATIWLRKNGIAVTPLTCASAPNPLPGCWPIPLKNRNSTSLEAIILYIFQVRKKIQTFFWTSKQDEWYRQIQMFFFTARVSQVNVNTMKRTFEQQSEMLITKVLVDHVLSGKYFL